MPSITNHGNSNQNYRETNSHTLGWPVPKKKKHKTSVGDDGKILEPLSTVGECKMVLNNPGKWYGSSSKY